MSRASYIARSAPLARNMPLLYDDPHRDVEHDARRELDRALAEIATGVVWANRATAHPAPKRPSMTVDPPAAERAIDVALDGLGRLWRITTPLERPRYEPPPIVTPWMDDHRGIAGAIAGYHDFENTWRSFGARYLVTDLAIADPLTGHGYYCRLDRRSDALLVLCRLNRWPSVPVDLLGSLEAAL